MLRAKSTQNHVGVQIQGTYDDLNNLYDALHCAIGNEETSCLNSDVQLRVLGLCYEVRHAAMGDRHILLEDNYMTEDLMKFHGIITPQHNVEYAFDILWPEMLFIMMVLNEALENYAGQMAKKELRRFIHKDVIWNGEVATVRMFQATILKCLSEIVSENIYKRLKTTMINKATSYSYYLTQYVDKQNIGHLKKTKENRLKNLSIAAKRLTEVYSEEYLSIKEEFMEGAEEYQCSISELEWHEPYPEHIEW